MHWKIFVRIAAVYNAKVWMSISYFILLKNSGSEGRHRDVINPMTEVLLKDDFGSWPKTNSVS